jgi:hypothetical protein
MANETLSQYVISHWQNHLKVIAIGGVIVAGVIGYNEVRDLQKQIANQKQEAATLAQKFQQLPSGSAIAHNDAGTQKQVDSAALTAFGDQVNSAMKQQNAKIESLTTVIGQVIGKQTQQAPASLPVFTPQTQTAGKLTDYPIDQQRDGAPALTSLHLSYDPTQTDPAKAFAGSTWWNHTEKFQTFVGEWQRQKDGGFRTTVKLTRTVTKPDPANPSKTIQVGVEDIPLLDAGTLYTPKGLDANNPFVTPRWTVNLGISNSTQNGYQPSATVDYRLFGRYGLYAGAANQAATAGISIRLGQQPK